MKKNAQYVILKEITVKGGKSIPVDTKITVTNGCVYMDGGLLPKDYQEDFTALIEEEEETGWKYLVPVREKEAFLNSKISKK